MKRSLILLLVVALLATMAPTIVLAEELDTFMVAMPEISGMLSRAKKTDTNQFVLQMTGTQNIISRVSSAGGRDSSSLMVVWTTSDRNIAGFNIEASKENLGSANIIAAGNDHNTITQILEADGNTPFPEIDGRAVGDVVFTGKAYWKGTNLTRYPNTTPLGKVEFIVHILPVWETKVTIKDQNGVEQVSQSYEYWLVDKVTAGDEILSVKDIPDRGKSLEGRTTVYNDPDKPTGNPNDWAATYGVGELIWTSSNEDIAKVDDHARVWFTGKAGTVTIKATAREEKKYPHTPKYATITYTIHEKPAAPEKTSPEEFKKLWFTADKLGVHRGCNNDYLNIARFLEQDPRPVGYYQSKGGQEHQDGEDGNYGVDDDIIWSSSNENIMWICRDKSHYTNGKGPNWQECYVEVSQDAKAGQKVTITATSKNNPELHDEIVLYVVANDAKTVRFERTAATVRVGDFEQIKILNDVVFDKYVTLTSSNSNIATASLDYYWDGNKVQYYVEVYGIEPGTTQITLQSSRYKFKAVADVTVVAGEGVKSVTVPDKYKEFTMPLYDVEAVAEVRDRMNTTNVEVNVNPRNAWYKTTWTSSDPSVAYVVYDGNLDLDHSARVNIRAAGVGKCKITVTVDDGIKTFKRSMTVTVVKAKATKLVLNKTKATHYLIKGGDNTMQLVATDKRSGEEVPVTWKSSDKKIAKVNKDGLVSIKKEGTVTITATTKDGYNTQKTCTLTVKKLAVTKVKPAVKAFSMKAGEQATLKVTVKPAKAYNPALSFKSSNKKVVTVDADGNLKAVKAGKAVITITAKDGSKKSAKVTITVKGTASNSEIAIGNDTAVGTENNIELTLDGVDGIDDLFIDDEAVFEVNGTSALELD